MKENMRDVFILGAGFSKAINSSMPTMEELSKKVIAKLNDSPFPIHEKLYRLGDNIESWMTYLSQPQPWLPEEDHLRNKALATEIRRHISDIISDLTMLSMESPAPEWLPSLIEHWHLQRCTVITLNYDTLIERASRDVPRESSPKIFEYHTYPPYFSNVASRHESAFGFGASKLETFSYLKLHGSTNWYYSGRDSFYGETIFTEYAEPWGTNRPETERSTASYSGDKTLLIIPPVTDKLTYFNNETVRRLWQEASNALLVATRVFVIGYSLPISDLGMEFFLRHSLPIKDTTWYIVDTSKRVLPRYRRLLVPSQRLNGEYVCEKNPVEAFAESYPNLP